VSALLHILYGCFVLLYILDTLDLMGTGYRKSLSLDSDVQVSLY
jgi:hypothetical protein